MEKPIGYTVTNRITGKVLNFKTGAAASKAMDRIDNAHGSYITTRRAIWKGNSERSKYAVTYFDRSAGKARRKVFHSLEAAKSVAEKIFAVSGIIVGIEEISE